MGRDLLEALNPPQREAVVHTDGPLLILAGAGSGKTRVLTHRVAYLIAEAGVAPGSILAVTFTNKAASEMKNRVVDLAGRPGMYVWISTFHSFCARVLRDEIESLGYKRSFIILDESDQLTAAKRCLKELNISGEMFKPQAVLSAISTAKNDLVGPEEYAANARDERTRTIGRVYAGYQQALARDNALDFDDLIMITVRLYRERPEVLAKHQERFRYIMVDEYQDTNRAQYMLIKLLSAKHCNICVVGDDDQSIYQWRGADIRNILDFERDYPNARVVKLEQNYRSTGTILDAANRVIANNRGRKQKTLWTSREAGAKIAIYEAGSEKEEARFIADETQRLAVAERRGYRDFAVLYRTNAQSRVIEEVLLNRGIPYRIVGGLKFYERREIKDVLAYLRVVENPGDSISLERIINVPRRGIGGTTLEATRAIAARNRLPLYGGVAMAAEAPELSARARKAMQEFVDTMEKLISCKGQLSVSDMVQRIMDETGYQRELELEKTIESESRIENLRELRTVTLEFEARQAAIAAAADAAAEIGSVRVVSPTDIGAFLEEVSLLTDLDRADLSGDSVTLMTLHSAKGLEFPVVFIAGMEENLFPLARSAYDPEALEEERRLCYVGITRAKDRLYLVRANQRSIYGATTQNEASRFLWEIPEDLLVDAFSWRYAGVPGGLPPSRAGIRTLGNAASGEAHARRGTATEVVKRAAAASAGDAEYSAGDRVRHARFGDGVVVSVVASGGDWVITIAFPAPLGIKQFAQSFAPIQKA